MDRQIVYAGSIPLDTDLLNMQRNVQVALGALAQMAVGLGPIIDGLGCYPGPAGPSVTMTPGSLTTAFANDGAPYGALAPDPMNVVQTGLLLTTVQIPLAEPGDAGHVTTWLIQAQLTEQDVGPVVLPYWNAANPSVPYSGPNNSGLAQATSRVVRVIFSAKASGPQVAGETAIPPPDAGWSGLFSVTTYFGKPVVDQSDIVPYALAPRLRYTLATIPPGPTTQLVYTASGSWTVPPQVRWARVRVIGGGGGGGCGDTNFSGGGGGAGGYAEGFVPLEPGRTYPILVGVGGLGGSLGSSGGWGNTSDFGGMVTAGGGEGGGAGNPDSHGGAPGQGARGSLLQSGGYGGDGCNTALVPGGNGGAGAFGGGGRGADEGGIPAFGIAGGSGGGGGYGTGSYGGGGAAGLVILEF